MFIPTHRVRCRAGHVYQGLPYPLVLVFLALAAFLLWGPESQAVPDFTRVAVDAAALSTEAQRELLGDPPTVRIAGFPKRCGDCHELFPPREPYGRPLQRHDHVRLEHGINDRCYNCHSLEDRDKLILPGGEEILYGQAAELCARCHGPAYRDWLEGMHGRTRGSWDSSSPEQQRLECTECHDPHSPAYTGFAPLPAPHTLRMGDQTPHEHEVRVPNPLWKWKAEATQGDGGGH